MRLLGSATNLEPTKAEQPHHHQQQQQQQQRLNWQSDPPGQDRFSFLGKKIVVLILPKIRSLVYY